MVDIRWSDHSLATDLGYNEREKEFVAADPSGYWSEMEQIDESECRCGEKGIVMSIADEVTNSVGLFLKLATYI